MTKGVMMDKPAKSAKAKAKKPNTSNSQRGFGILEMLFAASTLATTVLIAAINSSKRPPLQGD
jgi:hypothetical protein